MSGLSIRADQLRVALFGIAVRRAVVDYLRLVGLIMFILLMIAWTIDLAQHFPTIRASADRQGVPLASLLAPYLGYRSLDMIARLLPMACFFGVFLAEILRRLRLESIIFAAAGTTPLHMLSAVLWLGLILGSVQGMLEARWRPAAVLAQVDLGLGDYARWYRRGWLGNPIWFLDEDTAVRAEIRRTDDPEMRNLLIFKGIRAEHLQSVMAADHANPTDTPSQWLLKSVRIWDAQDYGAEPTVLPSLILDFDLIPEQVSYRGIQEFNIPTQQLQTIAARANAPNASRIQSAVWRRHTNWLLPPAIALLAIVLANAGFLGRVPAIPRLIGLAAVGYITVVAIKVFWALGRLGTLPVPISVVAPVVLALTLAVLFAHRRS